MPKTKNKKPDLTIAFLGGSTTHVVSVALKDRFPYLVGRLLEERLGKKVHSLNAAAPGSHTHHSINVLFNKVLPKNPDYVVIMHAINDLNILLLSNDYWNPTSLRYSIQRKFTLGNAFRYFKNEYFPYTYNAIVPQLHKFQLWRNIWKRALGGRVEGALGEKVDEWAKYRGKKAFFDEEHIKKKFKSAQLTAIRIAQSWGAIPMLLVQPTLLQSPHSSIAYVNGFYEGVEKSYGISSKKYYRLYKEFRQIVRNIAQDTGALVVDLDKVISKDPDNFLNADVVHLSTNGSKKSARFITNVLEKEILRCLEKTGGLKCL